MAATVCENLAWKVSRRKPMPETVADTPLRRCLSTFDLVMVGVGNMIGAGVFILTGTIAKEKAGPGIVISYLVAGLAVFLSSLCYAEFGARVPKAGSAYNYTYVTMGELWAFVIGWDLLLERTLGVAAVAKGFSAVVDASIGGVIKTWTLENVGEIDVPGLSNYADFVAVAVMVCVIIISSIGVKFLANANNIFTTINIIALAIVIGLCFGHGDWNNWTNASTGGFLPYGFQGVVAGAATLFYTYVGFESIATGGEEASNPKVQIPRATMWAMGITTTIYILAGSSLTLMVPYTHIQPDSAFTSAFLEVGLYWAAILVTVGALFGITTTLFADMFALPRVVYAMASDGLFFSIFAWVEPHTQTPLLAIVFFGTISALVGLLVDYVRLVSILAVGSLVAFMMVAISVLLQRYRAPQNGAHDISSDETSPQSEPDSPTESIAEMTHFGEDSESSPIIQNAASKDWEPVLKQDSSFLKGWSGNHVIRVSLVTIIVLSVGLALMFRFCDRDVMFANPWWVFIALSLGAIGIVLCLTLIACYEETNVPESFKVPLVPFLPALSIMINVLLLVQLEYMSLVRFAVWMVVGLCIYFGYGMHHSIENRSHQEDTKATAQTSYNSTDSRVTEPK